MSRRKKSCSPFAPVFRDVVAKPEWKNLSTKAKLLYIYLKLGFNGVNNGEITLPYSILKDEFSNETIKTGFIELVEAEWIEISNHGGLMRNSNKYRLTWKYDRYFKR